MSSIPAGRAAVRTREGWFSALGVKGRRAFRAAYAGYMLDAFDLIVLTLSVGLGGAIAFGVFGYVLAIAALLVLPETAGRDIA